MTDPNVPPPGVAPVDIDEHTCWNLLCIASFCNGIDHVDATGNTWAQAPRMPYNWPEVIAAVRRELLALARQHRSVVPPAEVTAWVLTDCSRRLHELTWQHEQEPATNESIQRQEPGSD